MNAKKVLGSVYYLASEKFQRGVCAIARTIKAENDDLAVVYEVEGKMETKHLGNVYGEQYGTGYAGNVWDKNGLSPTLMNMQGGGRQPMVTETRYYSCQTEYKIRKLTPLECWRLMGFSDEDFHKAKEVNSNSQLYKQAGNSIVEDVLMAIFRQMM